MRFKELEASEIINSPNKDLDGNVETPLLKGKDNKNTSTKVPPLSYIGDSESQIVRPYFVIYFLQTNVSC